MDSKTPLGKLLPELLEHLLLFAPPKDRLSFVSTCHQYWHLGATSTRLWETLDVVPTTLAAAQSFAAWLGSSPRQVKRLSLDFREHLSDTQPQLDQDDLVPIADSVLASLDAATLIALRWQPACRVQPEAFLRLQRLRYLEVLLPFWLPQHSTFVVPGGLSQLAALTSLRVAQGTTRLPGSGCLPAALRGLALDLGQPKLPPAISAATQLRRLQLTLRGPGVAGQALDASGLENLSQLTHLDLTACLLREAPPKELTALTALQRLGLVYNAVGGGGGLARLRPPITLRELDLSYCRLESLPTQLLQRLTGLKALSLVDSPLAARLPDAMTMLRCLELLAVDVTPLVGSLALIPELPVLRTLHVGAGQVGEATIDFDGLFRMLRGLSRLEQLEFNTHIVQYPASAAWLTHIFSFQRARPEVECIPDPADGLFQLPGWNSAEPWHEVA